MADDNTPDIDNRDRGLHRHGDADPSGWDEAQAVTGRPVDEAGENTTFAERAKARQKAVKAAENKSVDADDEDTKSRRATRRTSRKG